MDPLSLSDDEIDSRFSLRGAMEKRALLQDLLYRREPLSLQFNEGRDSLLTALLSVRDTGIVFDPSGDDFSNLKLLASGLLAFTARPDGVTVKFVCGPAHRVSWDKGEALWTPLPAIVTRLQRRDFFRVVTPIADPLLAAIEVEAADGSSDHSPVKLHAHDLSVGGIGLTLTEDDLQVDIGAPLPQVLLYLRDGEMLRLTGSVRHMTAIASSTGINKRRLGISFRDIPHHTEAVLQRLVIQIDQERRKLAEGNG